MKRWDYDKVLQYINAQACQHQIKAKNTDLLQRVPEISTKYVIVIVMLMMNGAEIVLDAFDAVDSEVFWQREGIWIEEHRKNMICIF